MTRFEDIPASDRSAILSLMREVADTKDGLGRAVAAYGLARLLGEGDPDTSRRRLLTHARATARRIEGYRGRIDLPEILDAYREWQSRTGAVEEPHMRQVADLLIGWTASAAPARAASWRRRRWPSPGRCWTGWTLRPRR